MAVIQEQNLEPEWALVGEIAWRDSLIALIKDAGGCLIGISTAQEDLHKHRKEGAEKQLKHTLLLQFRWWKSKTEVCGGSTPPFHS